MGNCIVCDIDGTVSDLTHRRHCIEKKPKDWKQFFFLMPLDTPHEHMRQVLLAFAKAKVNIVYCSGRPDNYRSATADWLKAHDFPVSPAQPIYMRKEGDYRADDIIKKELLEAMRHDGWEPIMAFDDRDRVVKMWRENGVPCAQVAEGNF